MYNTDLNKLYGIELLGRKGQLSEKTSQLEKLRQKALLGDTHKK